MHSFGKTEFGAYFPQLNFSFQEIRDRVLLADKLGYSSVWFYDHMYPPGFPKLAGFEGWTLISALAAMTDSIRLGHLVLCNGFRPPALLAKMAVTLDVISDGRLDLGIGTGSNEQEHHMFGYEFPSVRERTERLAEAIQLIKLIFTEELANFSGKYYSLQNAPSMPRPVQKPHPPIMVGGGGEKLTLPVVARHADVWNCPTYSLHDLERKIEVLRGECNKIGRDFDTLRISEEAVLVLAPTKEKLQEELATARRRFGGGGWGLDDGGFIGTPDEVIAQLKAKEALGVSLFMFFFHDRGKPETLELFAREVAPEFAKV